MKKILFLFLIVHCTLVIDNCFSQVMQEWVAIYHGQVNSSDGAKSLAVDGSGNVYVTGYSYSLVSGTSYDYVTIKYNSSGDSLWVRRYNGPGNGVDGATSLAVDGSGNVYVTGYSVGSGTNGDYATIKYNSSGDSLWVRRYNGPGNSLDNAYSLAVDGSGNVYVTGESGGIGTEYDYATIKYNSSGDSLWVRRYNGPGNRYDNVTSLAVDGSGNVYVTGESIGSGPPYYYDYATIKYNLAGVQQWVARYNGPGNEYERKPSLAVDGSGNVYVTGSSEGSGTWSDYATIKYNSSGDSLWVQRYNGPGNYYDDATSIAVDSGNVYVTGVSAAFGTFADYATIKYNSSGDSIWVARYNGPPGNSFDEATSITVDIAGNVFVTGMSEGNGTGLDYATIKYNSSGDSLWVRRYNGSGNSGDGVRSLAVDGWGNVYVTGGIWNGTDEDYATIKYSLLVGITPISNEIPNQFSLEQNYPNPFNPKTVVRYSLLVAGMTTLTIFDVSGRKVATIVNEQLNAGTYEVDFDGTNYASGVYYYRIAVHPQSGAFASDKLSADDPSAGSGQVFTETKMMVLVK